MRPTWGAGAWDLLSGGARITQLCVGQAGCGCMSGRGVGGVACGLAGLGGVVDWRVERERNCAVLTSAEGACVWRAAPSPDPRPGFVDSLASVAAVSLRRAWAVGDYFTGQEAGPQGAFIERWDGRSWRVVPAPGLRDATLGSVSASGADDVWAVGDRGRRGPTVRALGRLTLAYRARTAR